MTPRGRRGETIKTRQNGASAHDGVGNGRPAGPEGRRSGTITRVAAGGSLLVAIVLVVLILFGNGSTYTIKADFLDSGGLVTGNQVFIGPAVVGSVKSIGLTPDGLAQVELGISSSDGPMHDGTVARIYQNSLSGIANKYVVLEPGPSAAPTIPDGGTIKVVNTRSQVNLDQVFDTLGPQTREGLRGFIRGEAAAIQGKAPQASKTLLYFAPALTSTSDLTHELAFNEPQFDSLLVQGAQAMQLLAARTTQLTQLVANTSTATGAIASQSQSLEQALTLLAPTLSHTTSTYAGLRSTLDALDPLVQASIPASRRLAEFTTDLRKLTHDSIPTIGNLAALVRNPNGTGDLISLLRATPSLANLAEATFPRMIKEMNDSQAQVDYFRGFTPDVVAALSNLGQAGAYYDANGHYVRTMPFFATFGLDGVNQLQSRPPSQLLQGLQVVRTRCPGGAVQPPPDGSAPQSVPGCDTTSTPPGP